MPVLTASLMPEGAKQLTVPSDFASKAGNGKCIAGKG